MAEGGDQLSVRARLENAGYKDPSKTLDDIQKVSLQNPHLKAKLYSTASALVSAKIVFISLQGKVGECSLTITFPHDYPEKPPKIKANLGEALPHFNLPSVSIKRDHTVTVPYARTWTNPGQACILTLIEVIIFKKVPKLFL